MDLNVPKTLEPSNSSITYWQLEKEKSLIDGSAIEWEDQCRLRQVTSRLYLLVDDNFHVALSNNATDPRTVFRIHPVVKVRKLVRKSKVEYFQLFRDCTRWNRIRTFAFNMSLADGGCMETAVMDF